MHRAIAVFILVSGVLGCENVLEIELRDATSEIVVIAPFTPGIPWQVSLQRTVSIQDTSPKPDMIENALVKIQGDDGSVIELSHWGGGFYTSPTTFPKLGVTYTLTVEADGYKRVEASDRIPDPVIVRDVKISDSDAERLIEIAITDDGDTENYYELALINKDLSIWREEFIVTNPELEDQMRSFAIQDPTIPYVVRPELNRALIRDTPFNGKSYTISLKQIDPQQDPVGRSAYIRTVSKAHYEYYRSQIIQENANNAAFSEPANIRSNVQNGQGIFAGYHLRVHGEVTYQSIKDRITGTYKAVKYDYFDNGESKDYLFLGASIELTLNPDYSTSGQMNLPPLDTDSSTDDVKVIPLNGGYSILGYDSFYGYYILTLYHSSDTILRDLRFVIETKPFNSGEYFSLKSILRNPANLAEQSDTRFSGGSISLSRIEE